VTEAATPVSYKGWAGIKRAFGTPSALTMAMLGFGSGLPFLLIASQTLSTRLRDVGLDLGSIGLISLASFFYLLKFLWAPLLDRYAFPLLGGLGRRRSWLLVSQVMVLVGLVALAFVRPEQGVWPLVAWVLVASFAGATQDSAVDAYRIEIAPQTAQAALAATYTLGYRIGLILAGAGALYLAQFEGWIVAYLAMAALMLLPIITTLLCAEPERPATTVQRRIDVAEAFVQPITSFFSRNGVALALVLLAFVGLFKFPDQVIGVMAGPFYLDSGFDKADIATVSKLFGVWMGIGGAFLGTFLGQQVGWLYPGEAAGFLGALGGAILLLVLLRLYNRLRHRPPPLPADLPVWQVVAAKASHWMLYALMLAMPLIGWAMLSAGGYPVVLGGGLHLPPIVPHTPALYAALRNAHSLLAYVLFATVLMHVGAALFHLWVRRDGVFQAMARGKD